MQREEYKMEMARASRRSWSSMLAWCWSWNDTTSPEQKSVHVFLSSVRSSEDVNFESYNGFPFVGLLSIQNYISAHSGLIIQISHFWCHWDVCGTQSKLWPGANQPYSYHCSKVRTKRSSIQKQINHLKICFMRIKHLICVVLPPPFFFFFNYELDT